MTHATAANTNANVLTLNANSDLEIKYFKAHELTKAKEYMDEEEYIVVRANEHFNVDCFNE
ncbi:ATP-binding protein, partial [Klebsiella pneumoniae]|nr:ATP-binding protein [Klebsiella pneumoniae]